MVQVNGQDNKITIEMQGDIDELNSMQLALIELLQNYNYDVMGIGCGETVYFGLQLLKELLPDINQQQAGFIREKNFLELPESIPGDKKEMLKEAIFMCKYPDTKVRKEPNPIYQILQTPNNQ